MSKLIARILLSIFMLPLMSLFYVAAFVMLDEWVINRSFNAYPERQIRLFLACGATTWVPIAIYWVLTWYGVVRWNAQRVAWTVIVAVAATGAAAMCYMVVRTAGPDAAAFIASAAAPMLWVIGTVFVWRETAAERMTRTSNAAEDALVCPVCGYNLTGLSEPRCPECGSKFTLSDLIARQPHRLLSKAEEEIGSP